MPIKNLSSLQFEEIFDQIFDEKINKSSIKDFLLDLNKYDLPLNSMIGAVNSLKKRMKEIQAPDNAIDVCGTGGDKLNTVNISTAVSFVLAGTGITVAKHGNKAVSSKSGSADIFQQLNIEISSDKEVIEKQLNENKLCFLYAPLFHSSLQHVSEIRKSINQPTIFNFLGPLLNPANTKIQLIGTSKKNTMTKIIDIIATISKDNKCYVVSGFDGMDEITLTDNSYLLRFENGKSLPQEIINPEDYSFRKIDIKEIQGGNIQENAQKLLLLLNKEKSAYRDIVVLNSAFAIKLANKANEINTAIEIAKESIDSGKAMQVLTKMQKK